MKVNQIKRFPPPVLNGVTFHRQDSNVIEHHTRVLSSLPKYTVAVIRDGLAREIRALEEAAEWSTGDLEESRVFKLADAMRAYSAALSAMAFHNMEIKR